jgi:hypothetical protein
VMSSDASLASSRPGSATDIEGDATIDVMKEAPMKVTLTEPGLAGDYIVVEHNPDGSLVLAPDTSIEAIRRRTGTRPMTPEEFEERFGHLPSDGEG